MYKEVKLAFSAPSYTELNIQKLFRAYSTKLRLSNHKKWGRWITPKVSYNERRCTFCNCPDIQDEFHNTLCCAKFSSRGVKYIQPYYYRRPSMFKIVELMISENKPELHRLMVFLKLTFKLYMGTLLELLRSITKWC